MSEVSLNWIALIVAAFVSFLVGGVWYSALFAKTWKRLAGVTDEQEKSGVAKVFVGSFFLSLVLAIALSLFIDSEASAAEGAASGLVIGLGFVATTFGINYLFEHKPFGLFLINAGYNVVTIMVMGAIIGAF